MSRENQVMAGVRVSGAITKGTDGEKEPYGTAAREVVSEGWVHV